MTETQHHKGMGALRREIKQLKEARHHLGISERKGYMSEIKHLQEKSIDANKTYVLMIKYQQAYLDEKRKRKELERKLEHSHVFYKELMKERKRV